MEAFIQRHITILRRSVQWAAVILIILIPLLNRWGYHELTGTYYSISLWNLDIIDPAMMVQTILLSKEATFVLLLAGFIPLLFAFFFGKVFCSWMCPYNLIAEYATRLKSIFKRDRDERHNINPKMHYYWFILGAILSVIAVSGLPLIAFISLPGLISSQLSDLLFSGTIGIEIALVFLILVLEQAGGKRFWCKYVCPVGAMLAVPRWRRTLDIHYEPRRCQVQCSRDKQSFACNVACPLDLDPRQRGIHPYCYNCGACVEVCQQSGSGALSFTFGTVRSKPVVLKGRPKGDNTDETTHNIKRRKYGSE